MDLIERAQEWLARTRDARKVEAFGGTRLTALDDATRDGVLGSFLPVLRGLASEGSAKLLHVNTSPEVIEFVNSHHLETLAALGTSCPDHFLRTKIRPLVVPESVYQLQGDELKARLGQLIADYRADYKAYHERCKRPTSPPVRDANPVVVLLPRIGMIEDR